ncbi:MAG TPA: efflux RND transporter periplasmic adaptor subunit [Hyphomicrobiales bacterium]|nr:efflux RND transporter periplasmic adaptor subunit [Hyphomicrobiales bacterium]
MRSANPLQLLGPALPLFPKFPCLLLSVLAASYAMPVMAVAQQPAAAVPVSTVIAEAKPVSPSKDFVGRIEAIERVDVRARVTGYLEGILFKEGDFVKAGQPLYRIEKGLFQAAVEEAEGALEGAKASKALTKVELDRANQLMASSYGTPQKRDQALAADENAAANILKAEASLQTAKINLGYTDIISPIAGKVSRTRITKGNVVSPESGVLTTVVSQDPMYVVFPVSQRELLQVRRDADQIDPNRVEATVRFSDGSSYGHKGRINFVDVTVDKATDTVTVRATLPNPDGILIDGQLVRINVDTGKPADKIVIPQAALIADQEGTYVFAVQDGKAVVRRVKLGGEIGANVAIDSGLKAGEQIIVEGIQGVKPGTAVLASPMPREARS